MQSEQVNNWQDFAEGFSGKTPYSKRQQKAAQIADLPPSQ
jgi:hypothetical protein